MAAKVCSVPIVVPGSWHVWLCLLSRVVDHAHGPSGPPGSDNDAAPSSQARLAPMASWRRTFPGEPRQLGELRRWITSLLPPRPPRDDVTSVADELASNAIRHTRSGQGGQFTVEITRHGPLVRVTVTDDGAPSGPQLAVDPQGEHGRGLVVVNALAVRAGIHGDHQGRRVWADIGWDASSPALARPVPSRAPARVDDAAIRIRDGEAALGSRFGGVPAWYGRATHAWWALTDAALITAPSAAELAGLLSRLPETRAIPAPPGQREPLRGHAHRCA
jgi:serine/threonine-protein kinase RsbW